jgi:hypothetical protein
MVQLNFDATQVDPNKPFDVLPPGKYAVQIVQSEMRESKKTAGNFHVWLEMEVTDGEHKGRKLWDRLNTIHTDPQTVEIANKTLSAICRAVGVMQLRDTEQLHFRRMQATVRVEPAKGDFAASNKVKGYEPIGGAAPLGQTPAADTAAAPGGSTASPTSAPAAAAAAAKATPPWRQARG